MRKSKSPSKIDGGGLEFAGPVKGLPATRKEALALGLARYFTGKPCKHGHVADRNTQKGDCWACKSIAIKRWQRSPAGKAYNARKNKRHIDSGYRAAFLDTWTDKTTSERSRKCRAKNGPKIRARERELAKFRIPQINAKCAKRHASKLKRTPTWLTVGQLAQIEEFYEHARRLTELHGGRCVHSRFEVHHMAALQAEFSAGLHVPWNLEVVTQFRNLQIGNRT